MSAQIERIKDQLGSHKEEAQKYKQKCITLEQRLIETEARLNKSEESQMSHDNIQDKLHKRCYIQDYFGIESVINVRSALGHTRYIIHRIWSQFIIYIFMLQDISPSSVIYTCSIMRPQYIPTLAILL